MVMQAMRVTSVHEVPPCQQVPLQADHAAPACAMAVMSCSSGLQQPHIDPCPGMQRRKACGLLHAHRAAQAA